ncbi:MAG: glutathione S-transferase N-terminal domain-containing protein [bacterium]
MKKEITYTLYMYRSCPFCIKVQNFMDAKGLKLPTVYLDDDHAALEDLYNKTQSAQAPCLQIDDEYMRESDDIIAYIDDTWG